MSVNYYKKMGKMIVAQEDEEFEISIWTSNCIACFNYEWSDDKGDWIRLYTFFNDEGSMKRIYEKYGNLFDHEVKSIHLDMSFPQAKKLARLLKKFGYEVDTDYHQPE